MDLKLTNNNLLSLGSTISSSITTNCTTVFVKNCPNVSGIAILKQCPNLTRVRLDIGNISGSLGELLQYSTLNGFNDSYENQTKPRLVGTWTVNDWYTQEQLTAVRAAFDGLTIVEDSNYIIDFSQVAVQSLDSNQPNYNPAVAIILHGQSKGNTCNNPIVTGGGRWFITKTEAATITNISTWFKGVTSVTDTNNIVSSSGSSYNFTSFKEFRWFLGITVLDNQNFRSCTNLQSIGIPTSVTKLGRNGAGEANFVFYGCSALTGVYYYGTINDWFKIQMCWENENNRGANPLEYAKHLYINDSLVTNVVIDDNTITMIYRYSFINNLDVTSITITSPVTLIEGLAFQGCTALTTLDLPDELTTINSSAFKNCTSLTTIDVNNALIETILDDAFHNVPYQFTNSDLYYIKKFANDIWGNGITLKLPTSSVFPSIIEFNLQLAEELRNKNIELGSGLTTFRCRGFAATGYIHILAGTPPTLGELSANIGYLKGMIYVGDGTSSTGDNAILQAYIANSKWATVYNANKLDTWYNYLHPQS